MGKNLVEIDPQKFPWLDLRRYTFSMGVEKNGVVYISGQSASAYYSEEGKVLCKGDLAEQTKLALEKIGVVLQAAGLGFENVVKMVQYLNPGAIPQYPQLQEVIRQYFGTTPVAATVIGVDRLLRPDGLIEISAVAMKDRKKAVEPGWRGDLQVPLAPAVQAGNILWFSGLTSSGENEREPKHPKEAAAQVDLCYRNVAQVLEAADSQPSDIIYSMDYITPEAIPRYDRMVDKRTDFFGGQYPAASRIVVNRLRSPDAHIAVETIAVTSSNRQEIRIPEWEGAYKGLTYCPGVVSGPLLCISGQIGVDYTTGESVGGDNILAQTDQIYSNISQILATAGYSMDDVANTIEWVVPAGLADYRGVHEVRRKYFGDRFPVATGVVMPKFLRPESLIEVTAVALV